MKYLFVTFYLFCFFSVFSQTQKTEKPIMNNDCRFIWKQGVHQLEKFDMNTTDFQFQLTPAFFKHKLSIAYSLGLYKEMNQNNWQLEFPKGPFLGVYTYDNSLNFDGGNIFSNIFESIFGNLFLFAVTTLIPNEIEYYFYEKRRIKLSTYMTFASSNLHHNIEYNKYDMTDSFAIGTKLNLMSMNKNDIYSFFIAYKSISEIGKGLHIGASISFLLRKQKY